MIRADHGGGAAVDAIVLDEARLHQSV